MTPKLATFVREYKAGRESLYIQMGYVLSLDDLVFTNFDFKPLNPLVLSHYFKNIADRAGFHGLRFHDLRHTFALVILLRGISPKIVSEAISHASVSFTMDVYSHIIKGMQEDAMKTLDEVMPDVKFNANYIVQNKNSKSINANLTPIFDNNIISS